MRILSSCLAAPLLISATLAAFADPTPTPTPDPNPLPLLTGYYVAEGSDCETGNDSTLALVHVAGINPPGQLCTFSSLEAEAGTGPGDGASWSFTSLCANPETGAETPLSGRITIPSSGVFLVEEAAGKALYSYCLPNTLPPPYNG